MTDYNKHFVMSKEKGDRKVRTWQHPRSGLSADIFLRGTRFVALFLEKLFEAPDVRMIEKKMADYAEHWIQMEWHPVIEIQIDESYRGYAEDRAEKAGLSFSCDRYYLSQSPTGEIFSVVWNTHEEHRKAQMQQWESDYRYRRGFSSKLKLTGLPLRAPLEKADNNWLMDYTEDVWRGFMEINRGINQMKRRLHELVSTREGLAQLEKGAQLLLNR